MTTLTKKKKPFQIYLRTDQLEALRQLAQQQDVSVAALVRQGVDQLLLSIPVEDDPLMDIIGLGDSGLDDLSINHDAYLAETAA